MVVELDESEQRIVAFLEREEVIWKKASRRYNESISIAALSMVQSLKEKIQKGEHRK